MSLPHTQTHTPHTHTHTTHTHTTHANTHPRTHAPTAAGSSHAPTLLAGDGRTTVVLLAGPCSAGRCSLQSVEPLAVL